MKLHLGCGEKYLEGFVHVDLLEYNHIDYKTPIDDLHFAKDSSVEMIYASHVLEHTGRLNYEKVLIEWYRVLKPKGVLRLAVPDFEAMAIMYVMARNTINQFKLGSFLGPLYGKMQMGGQTIYHKTTYDFDGLSEVLKSVGIESVERYDWKDTEHADFDDHSQAYIPHMEKDSGTLISLNVEGVK